MKKHKHKPPEQPSLFTIDKPVPMEQAWITKRRTKYEGILAAMQKLKPGECFLVQPANGPASKMNVRLNATLSRFPVEPPEGCRFRKQTRPDGKLAICCVRIKKGA